MSNQRKVLKVVKADLYLSMFLRGEPLLEVPISNLEEWVESFDDYSTMKRLNSDDPNKAVFEYKPTPEEREFPPHFHDGDECFEIKEGSLVMEYIDHQNKYQRRHLVKGDKIRMDRGQPHRGKIKDHLVAILTFEKPKKHE